MKVEKRFKQGGTLLASYTFSKLMANVSTLTTWLNGGLGATPGVQNPYNIAAEKSLSGFDARSRLTVSYALDLPFGPGQPFLNGGSGVQKKLVGGWTVSGISTFGDGFPLALTATGTSIGTGYGRPPIGYLAVIPSSTARSSRGCSAISTPRVSPFRLLGHLGIPSHDQGAQKRNHPKQPAKRQLNFQRMLL